MASIARSHDHTFVCYDADVPLPVSWKKKVHAATFPRALLDAARHPLLDTFLSAFKLS